MRRYSQLSAPIPYYLIAFQSVFGVNGKEATIDHVAQAIASFERTLVAGNSAFDRYYFKGQADAMTDAQVRGFNLFVGQGRCVSCHTIEQDQALFTDSRFHNIGIGINQIQQDGPRLTKAFLEAKNKGGNVAGILLKAQVPWRSAAPCLSVWLNWLLRKLTKISLSPIFPTPIFSRLRELDSSETGIWG